MSAVHAPTTPPAARRTRGRRPVTSADVRSQAKAVVRSRWPGLNPDYVGWRTVARYRTQTAAGQFPDDLVTWTRSAVYELAVEDQRADRGATAHAVELDALLHELAHPAARLVDRAVLGRAVAHLHPRDIMILRLLLAGHRRPTVADRVGVGTGEIDAAYGRARARLRATIGADPQLQAALRRAHELLQQASAAAQRPRLRPMPRFARRGAPPPLRSGVA
ncbi:hypothetical protein [Microlunatus ginsengisoli]|uniref:Sigma-70 family RNA polymerase sigma factor n=1 Tax=Microlunatus ginsengisoli TaxID=363863 RepID=A0ABP6ZMT0_9ACTN